MAFEDVFKVYANKNLELRMISKKFYEFGKNIAQEPSAGMSIGLDEHARNRQREYVKHAKDVIDSIFNRPIPDMPYIHPTRFDINLSDAYKQFTVDEIVLNEDTQLLAESWMAMAAELAMSQSAGMAGSLTEADHRRADNGLAVITQYLDEMDNRDVIDVPETAFPGAPLEVPGESRAEN